MFIPTVGTLRMVLMWGVLGFLAFGDFRVALILQIICVGVAMVAFRSGEAIAENFLD